jgi:uncharacterized protein YceK
MKVKRRRVIIAALLTVIISGCGSYRTLSSNAENNLAYGSAYKHTDCESIPRVYSGVCLDACMAFIGPPGDIEGANTQGVFAFYTFDILMSGIIDTAALPYTLVMQARHGSYKINTGN